MARRVIPPFPPITNPGDLIYGRPGDGNPAILPVHASTGRVLTISAAGVLSWEPGGGGGSGHDAVTVVDSTSIDFTLGGSGQELTAVAIFGTVAGTVAEGNHLHTGVYSDVSHTHSAYAFTFSDTTSIDFTVVGSSVSAAAIFGSSAGTVAEGNHTHANDHVAATVVDTASIDMSISGQQISAAAIFGTTATTIAQGNHTHANDHVAATVTDSDSIDFTLTGQNITAVAIFGTTATTVAAGNHTHANDHVAATVADTASIDMTISGQQISAAAIFGTTATTVAVGNHTHGNDPTIYTLVEDFEAPHVNGLNFNTSGTFGTPAKLADTLDHPGVWNYPSGATSGNTMRLHSGLGVGDAAFNFSDNFDFYAVFAPASVVTNIEWFIGLSFSTSGAAWGANNSLQPHIGLKFDTTSGDAAWFMTLRNTATTTTTTSTAPANGTWVKLRCRRIDASTVGITFNNNAEVTFNAVAAVPTGNYSVHVWEKTTNATSKIISVDLLRLYTDGVSR